MSLLLHRLSYSSAIQDIKERIGLNGNYEENAIYDYELLFEVNDHKREYGLMSKILDWLHTQNDNSAIGRDLKIMRIFLVNSY